MNAMLTAVECLGPAISYEIVLWQAAGIKAVGRPGDYSVVSNVKPFIAMSELTSHLRTLRDQQILSAVNPQVMSRNTGIWKGCNP